MKKLFTAILLIALAICTAVAFAACNETIDPETPSGDKEFVITTNITDGAEVEEQEYTFTVSATYGGEDCTVEVALNGTTVEGNGTYTVQLAEGENVIKITAKSGEESESKEYKVTYTKPEPSVEEKEFVVTTNITDGAEVEEQEYTFTASATYGGEDCTVEVALNGTTVEGNGTYTVQLAEGENVIKVTAKSGEESESKEYKVTYTKPVPTSKLKTDLVGDDDYPFEISFKVWVELPDESKADLSGNNLNVSIAYNDSEDFENLATWADGALVTYEYFAVSYNATDKCFEVYVAYGIGVEISMTVDEVNSFRLKIELDDESYEPIIVEYYWDFDNPKVFTFDTSLTDGVTVNEENYSFTASAKYGDKDCEMDVRLNGVTVLGNNGNYTVSLREGENTIRVTAISGANSETKQYRITHIATKPVNPPTISTSITNDLEIHSDIYNFEVIAHDSVGNNISATVTFAVDWDADDNEENFVTVTGITTVWADSDKTSYSIDLSKGDFAEHKEKTFIFKITATALGESASVEYRITYIPAEDGDSIGNIVFSIEGFTIGMGYFVEPTLVPIRKGVNGAQMLVDIIEENGWGYDNTGKIESGFYLEAITNIDLTGNYIPDELWEYVQYFSFGDRTIDQNFLGEFDYTFGSGWMYSVNGSFYNYGFSDYIPRDGDVVRVQFTLYYGQDIGGSSAMGGGGFGGDSWQDEDVDYAEIMMLLADINSQSNVDLNVYNQAIEAIGVWNISQAEMDEWISKLRSAYGEYL